ncbi:hypothetical protein MyNCGM70_11440 [Achromobacter xylosoxidans]
MTCACPGECAPQHKSSPGVIEHDELILFVLVNPTTYKNGDLSAGCFSDSQLKKGVQSVCRIRHTTAEEIDRCVVAHLIKKEGRELHGSAAATAGEIRAIRGPGGGQAFCVVDDPLHDEYNDPSRPDVKFEVFLAHAHLGFSAKTLSDESWNKNTRVALMATLASTFKTRGCPIPIANWYA